MPAATLLTKAEQDQLDKLLAKANAGAVHTPALRLGDPYLALINLSVPRRNQVLKPGDVPQTDLVHRGETVYLTADEAALFSRCDPDRDGRRVPVVRKLSEGSDAPYIHPSLVSGPTFRPGPPPPGGTGPRPDPAGSSKVIETSPVPESVQDVPGSENGSLTDALDIPPGGAVAAGASVMAGADMDVVNAAKAAMGRRK